MLLLVQGLGGESGSQGVLELLLMKSCPTRAESTIVHSAGVGTITERPGPMTYVGPSSRVAILIHCGRRACQREGLQLQVDQCRPCHFADGAEEDMWHRPGILQG